jgi:cation diffusion facilitator CzcD-associated flavoprotein CzcO
MKQNCEVAIIGAGPYGLSVAAQLGARGVDYRIFGKPMDSWAAHMPKNMTLKSEGFASNLSGPATDASIKSFFQRNNIAYSDQGTPIALDDYLRYADNFRSRFVPTVETKMVTTLAPTADGFELVLDTGECVSARRVVMAVGISWFAHTPDMYSALPKGMVSHSFDHRDVSQFRNREVTVIGAGSSAIDLAHLLQESGASVRIVARAEQLAYNTTPDPEHESLLFRLQNPPSTIGRGWRSYFCAQAPLLFYRLPRHLKDRAIASHMHPSAGWFMREQVEGRIPLSLGRTPVRAEAKDGRVALTLRTASGSEEMLGCDHVIAATGYRVDLAKIPFLSAALRERIALSGTSPYVSDNFETTVPGLYTIGLTAMDMFGPLLRFMVGSEFAAPRLAAHLERKSTRTSERRAA